MRAPRRHGRGRRQRGSPGVPRPATRRGRPGMLHEREGRRGDHVVSPEQARAAVRLGHQKVGVGLQPADLRRGLLRQPQERRRREPRPRPIQVHRPAPRHVASRDLDSVMQRPAPGEVLRRRPGHPPAPRRARRGRRMVIGGSRLVARAPSYAGSRSRSSPVPAPLGRRLGDSGEGHPMCLSESVTRHCPRHTT
jgi:hypothetical protein